MRNLLILILPLLFLPGVILSQNVTDSNGKKQGAWVKKYPNGNKMYEGTFKDNKPVGLFKRYNQDGILVSELTYSEGNDEAMAVFFFDDGVKAAEGLYVAHKKEGLWRFWSATRPSYLICEESYTNDLRNGLSQKFYPDSTLAEKSTWDAGKRTGEWLQYYPDGSICLNAEYINGKLEGLFSYYYPNGKLQYEGSYKEDFKTGDWLVFNEDGSVKRIITYKDGVPNDPELAKQETKFLDDLEKNKDKIKIEDITGTVIK